jgi:hypothetical protein
VLTIVAVPVFLVFGATVTVIASTAAGETTMLDLATAGLPANVDVSVVSSSPIVPQNMHCRMSAICQAKYPGRRISTSGTMSSIGSTGRRHPTGGRLRRS